jgi:hypothetical protein
MLAGGIVPSRRRVVRMWEETWEAIGGQHRFTDNSGALPTEEEG